MLKSIARRLFFRYRKDESGATVVEFAIVALPFFMLVFGILEIGLMTLSQTSLKNAIRETTRLTRVGDARDFTAAQFKSALCTASDFLPNCDSNLLINQRVTPVYAPNPYAGGLSDDNAARTNAGDIVVFEAQYDWQILAPILVPVLGANGVMRFQQGMVFKTEPFD